MGEVGEICINGPTMMMGYYNNPEETDYIMRTHADGRKWIHTGDLGYMDEDGFLYIQGRIKRVIIRTDGFKVYPHVIEDVINACPDVMMATAVGTVAVGEVQGQDPHVFFTLRAECEKTADEVIDELKKMCDKKLAEYVQPKYFTCLDEMPMTAVGKIDYKNLEKQALELLEEKATV